MKKSALFGIITCLSLAVGAGVTLVVGQPMEVSAGSTTKTINSFSETSGTFDGGLVTYAALKGGAGTAPAINNKNVRLYQGTSSAVGGFVTLTAETGTSITGFSVTSSSTYDTTIGYSIGDVETCATDKTALAKSSTYSKSFLASSKVSFGCWGTTKTTRLEIASISVTYDSEDHVVSALMVTPTTKADVWRNNS